MTLWLRNDGDAAAHFAIYPYGGELPAPAHLDVSGEEVETLAISGPYEVAVQGPNRFWAELAGSADGLAAGLDVRLEIGQDGLVVVLANHSSKPLSVKVKALGYGSRRLHQDLRGRQTLELAWPTEQGWYDLEVTVAEDPTYRRRDRGHHTGISDRKYVVRGPRLLSAVPACGPGGRVPGWSAGDGGGTG